METPTIKSFIEEFEKQLDVYAPDISAKGKMMLLGSFRMKMEDAHAKGVEEGRDAFAAKVAADFRNMGSLGDSSALFVEDTLYEFRTSTSE